MNASVEQGPVGAHRGWKLGNGSPVPCCSHCVASKTQALRSGLLLTDRVTLGKLSPTPGPASSSVPQAGWKVPEVFSSNAPCLSFPGSPSPGVGLAQRPA